MLASQAQERENLRLQQENARLGNENKDLKLQNESIKVQFDKLQAQLNEERAQNLKLKEKLEKFTSQNQNPSLNLKSSH